jgi:uncharacterized membrane protein
MRNEDSVINGKKIIFIGILLGLFIGMGLLFFADFSVNTRELRISNLFLTPIPILIGILVYLTVMGTRKVMDDE